MLIDISLQFSRGKKNGKKESVPFFLNEKTYVELYDGEVEIV